MAAAVVVSCKGGDEKKVDNIIVEKVVQKPKKDPQRMNNDDITDRFSWVDNKEYSYKIQRRSSDSLSIVENAGLKYYDNTVELSVIRSDGSVFFNKTFSKKNFAPGMPEKYQEHGVLLGMNFFKVEGGQLQFVVGVGSPDESLEDLFNVMLIVDSQGSTSIAEYHEPVRDAEDEE